MKGNTFYLTLEENWFKKKDILTLDQKEYKVKVIKTYPFNWWRKLLFWMGFEIKSCKVIKVQEIL